MLAYKVDIFVSVGILMAHMVKHLKKNAIGRAKMITLKSAGHIEETLYTLSKIKVLSDVYILLRCDHHMPW